MHNYFFVILLLFQLVFLGEARAEKDKAQNLLFSEFDVFEFTLINYSNITHDVILGNGEYLDTLYQYSQCKHPEHIFNSLKDSLLKPHSIAGFSRYVKLLLQCE
jgi:hypothetical protein